MAINDLLQLPAEKRAEIAVALLDSLSPRKDELSAEAELDLIRQRDDGEFISADEFFTRFKDAGYGKPEL